MPANHNALSIRVDPARPEMSLEHCAMQIEMMASFMSSGPDVDFSDLGAAGLCDLLWAVSATLQEVQQLMHAERRRAA